MSEPEVIDLDGIALTLRHSTRAKRIQIRIDQRARGAELVLPAGADRARALAFARGRRSWIAERIADLPQPVAFTDGTVIPYLGAEHRLVHCPGARVIQVHEGEILVPGEPAHFERRVQDFLKAEIRKDLRPRADDKASRLGRTVGRMAIKDTKSRWGSCSRTGNLNFNWRLVFAPEAIRDYLVAHEAAHLRHMNHGPDFWELAEELTDLTTVKQAESWLSRESRRLFAIG